MKKVLKFLAQVWKRLTFQTTVKSVTIKKTAKKAVKRVRK